MIRVIALCVLGLGALPAANAKEAAPVSAVSGPAAAYEQARAHFAKALRIKVARVIPQSLEHRDTELKALETGDLFPFVYARGRRRVQGFASADGRVVLPKKSPTWTHLFKAAQLLEPGKSLDAPGMARRMVWLTQQGDLVLDGGGSLDAFGAGPGGDTWPTIHRGPEGAVLRYSWRARSRRTRAGVKSTVLKIAPDYTLRKP